MTPEERFWAKVDKTGECWLWTAATDRGYGFFFNGTKMVPAHRWAYENSTGPIPEGMLIDHICHTKACVNPAHLRLATQKQNGENRRGAQANSRSGVRGVSWDDRRGHWVAQIGHHGRHIYVGSFATVAEAEAAVIAKREELFTHA